MAANDPEAAAFRAEHLYPREAVANYRFGSVLLYRHDTWHRGRPVKPGTLRLAQNLTFTKSGREWLSPASRMVVVYVSARQTDGKIDRPSNGCSAHGAWFWYRQVTNIGRLVPLLLWKLVIGHSVST